MNKGLFGIAVIAAGVGILVGQQTANTISYIDAYASAGGFPIAHHQSHKKVLGANTVAVTVGDVTPTQVILLYTAPSNSACTVEVSQSTTYSPLAHDVDPALFPGSNLDSRAGDLNNGAARILVIGKRAAEQSPVDGNYYSRALQAYTTYYYRVTCGSAVATGSFMTGNIPLGDTYNDPLPVDPNVPGSYAWPTLHPTQAENIVDPQTGLLLFKPVIQHFDGSPPQFTPDKGEFVQCAAQTVTTPSSEVGSICKIDGILLFINSSTGSVRELGDIFYGYNDFNGGSSQDCDESFNLTDPTIFYCVYNAPDSTHWIVKMQYQGDFSQFTGNLDSCALHSAPCVTVQKLTANGSIEQQMQARDSSALVNYGKYIAVNGYNDGQIYFHFVTLQNGPGWVGTVDPTTGLLTAMMSTVKNPAGSPERWCGIHNSQPEPPIYGTGPGAGYAYTGQENLENSSSAFSGPYQMDIASGVLNTSVLTCPANPLGVTGQQCSTVTIDHQPMNPSPISPDTGYVQDLGVGDYLEFANNKGDDESFRVVAISGSSITLQRGIIPSTLAPTYGTSNWSAWLEDFTGNNQPLEAECGGGSAMWNFGADPWGTNPSTWSSFYLNSHAAMSSNNVVAAGAGYQVWSGPLLSDWSRMTPPVWPQTTTADYIVSDNPPFNGISGIASASSNTVDSHPNIPNDAGNWFLDGRPLDNSSNISIDGTVHNAVNISGNLWRLRSNAYGGSGTDLVWHPQYYPVYAYSGTHPLADISGPNSVIDGTSAHQYQYCVVKNAGECQPGSSVGDVFVNSPGVTAPYCDYPGIALVSTAQDICLGDNGAYTMSIPQMSLAQTGAATGANSRLLTHGFNHYQQQDVFWTGILFTNNVFAFNVNAPNGNLSPTPYFGLLPPQPSTDGVIRNNYVSTAVNITPPGGLSVNNAVVEFGYAENGNPTQYYCTSRKESCIKGSQSGSQFNYASDTVTGVPCSSGCTINIPLIPERTAYMQVLYRNSSNVVIGSSQPGVATERTTQFISSLPTPTPTPTPTPAPTPTSVPIPTPIVSTPGGGLPTPTPVIIIDKCQSALGSTGQCPVPTPAPTPIPCPNNALCLPVPTPTPAQNNSSSNLTTSFASNTLVHDKGTIYLIEGQSKIGFTSYSVFTGLGFSLKNVVNGDTSAYQLSEYVFNSPDQEHAWGEWLLNNRTVYYFIPQGLIPVSSWQFFISNGGLAKYIVPMTAGDMADEEKGLLYMLSNHDNRISR